MDDMAVGAETHHLRGADAVPEPSEMAEAPRRLLTLDP